MKPIVGSVVHCTSPEDGFECRAAIVTEVMADPRVSVGLCVLNPTGQEFIRAVPMHGGTGHGAGGSWHWPEPVKREPGDRPPRF